ncbi:MAG: dipeptidyl aminopeptidase/acylaminoacyl peptidase [Myxococcota bacterium]
MIGLLWLLACGGGPDDGEIVSARVRDATDAWTHYDVTYGSAGLRVAGQVVLPLGKGPWPIALVAHGGFDGIDDATTDQLRVLARRGMAVFAPEYRGEGGSEGEVEYCAGEVDDTLALLRVADQWRDTDPDRVVAVGTSHGACVSLLAASRTDRLAGVAAMGTPADVGFHIDWHHERGNHRFAREWEGYLRDDGRAQSPMYHADTMDLPVVLLHGLDDVTVPLLQACMMRDALAGHMEVASYRMTPDGELLGELADCQGVGMSGDWHAAPQMDDGVVLVSVEGAAHKPSADQWHRAFDALEHWVR